MNDIAWLLGSLTGKLADPLAWVAIAIAFGIGLWRPVWWAPAAIAFVVQLVIAIKLYAWWQSLGLDVSTRFFTGLMLLAALTYAAFALARLWHHIKPV